MGGDPMKPSSAFVIICICIILSGLIGSGAADSVQYDKSTSISMNIDEGGKITVKSVEIYYGSAPHLFPMQEGFKGELVTADGATKKRFTIWDPRIQFGDVFIHDAQGPRIQGFVDQQKSADFVVIFPFDRNVTEFRLYNSAGDTLISSVTLKPWMDSFFASYPEDPDNPALSGSETPVISDTSRSGTQVPGTESSGQFWGLLSIGAGGMLLLGGAFAYMRFMKKKPRCVLIVDDNADIIEVITSMLASGGYTTRAAMSGEECLEELESAVPDLILLDIGMEPMDGWKTLQRIKKNPATRLIPVIMLTGRELIPGDVENYGICIEDYIQKPVTLKELNDAITHVFTRRQKIRKEIAAAKGAGIDRDELCECARLTRVVDVNKRLWSLLVTTYNREAGMSGPESEIPLAIKNTKRKIRDQEYRLEQIRRKLGYGMKG
jgi:CheY-like chemotaxis protein